MRRAALLLVLAPALAHAQSTAPAIVELVGDQPVGVHLSAGSTVPCDSDNNKKLFRGVLKPGAPLKLDTDTACVCYEQTFAPFTTTGWSAPNLACRPRRCVGSWGKKTCWPDMTKPIRITVRSKQ